MATLLLILHLQVPTDHGLVFLINCTHFWITCYKPIFFFYSSNFSSLGKFMLVPGICRHTPRRPASKNSFAFLNLPQPSVNYSYLLLMVLLSLLLTPYALPTKKDNLWCYFPSELFYFHDLATCFTFSQSSDSIPQLLPLCSSIVISVNFDYALGALRHSYQMSQSWYDLWKWKSETLAIGSISFHWLCVNCPLHTHNFYLVCIPDLNQGQGARECLQEPVTYFQAIWKKCPLIKLAIIQNTFFYLVYRDNKALF